MNRLWKHGKSIVAVLCVMLVLITAACGNGDDDDDETPTSVATTAASAPDATPTTARSEATTTESDATATDEGAEDSPTATTPATATEAEESEEPTATTGAGGATPTESGSVTTPTTDDELGDFETLDPELLPNFSLTMNFVATNMSGVPETNLQMQMEQSDIDNYHFNMNSEGELLEFWTIGDQSWTSIGGEVMESPTGPMFRPADILTTGELIPEGLDAQREGTEQVNGRETTKWVIDGADYVAYMNAEEESNATGIEMSDGSGEVVVWVDNELNIMLKAEGDVAWSNSDGTDGTLVYDYEIYDIGSTADIVAPL